MGYPSADSYNVTLTAIDLEGHNWWQKTTAVVRPLNCVALADNETLSSFRNVTYVRRPIRVDDVEKPAAINKDKSKVKEDPVDLCLSFNVIESCPDPDDATISDQLTIQTQPKLPVRILNSAVKGFEPNKKKFTVCFNQETMNSPDFPTDVPINMIFTVSWTKARSNKVASMDIVYRLSVSDPIIVSLMVASNQTIEADESVLLDARSTLIANQTDDSRRVGITFKWKCPEPFQSMCDSWLGSPVMEITPEMFAITKARIKTPYAFEV